MKRIGRFKQEAQALADAVIGKDNKPAYWSQDQDTDTAEAARQPFTAWELAQRRNQHHPQLWQAVKGSPYERLYRMAFNPSDQSPAGTRPSRGYV